MADGPSLHITNSANFESASELEKQIEEMQAYIDVKLADAEPYHDDQEGETSYRWYMLAPHGESLSCAKTVNDATGNVERDIALSTTEDNYSLTMSEQYHEDYGHLMLLAALGKEKDVEVTGETAADLAEKDNDAASYIAKIYDAMKSGKFEVVQKRYDTHPVPNEILNVPLSSEDVRTFAERVSVDRLMSKLMYVMPPITRMEADTGDSWLASGVFVRDQTKYVVLYRDQDEPEQPYQAHVVYTSLSQASWRLVPQIGRKDKPIWHYKTSLEELVTLPAGMQKQLWEYAEEAPLQEGVPEHVFMEAVSAVCNDRFDTYLSGLGAEQLDLSMLDNPEASLPVESNNAEPVLYGFASPLYGEVEVRKVPSRDGALTYYTYTRVSDGMRWIGMIETDDVRMFDSFLPDKTVAAPGYYASPLEYPPDAKGRNYIDNTDNVLASPAVKALNGEI